MLKLIIFYMLLLVTLSLYYFAFIRKSHTAKSNVHESINDVSADRFKDKVIFITGGTSGIGLATAVQFALAEGPPHVIVCGRRKRKMDRRTKIYQRKIGCLNK